MVIYFKQSNSPPLLTHQIPIAFEVFSFMKSLYITNESPELIIKVGWLVSLPRALSFNHDWPLLKCSLNLFHQTNEIMLTTTPPFYYFQMFHNLCRILFGLFHHDLSIY